MTDAQSIGEQASFLAARHGVWRRLDDLAAVETADNGALLRSPNT